MINHYLFAILLCFSILKTHAQLPITPSSNTRIAISSDGNHHDQDDIAATPVSLMILAKAGLQDNLVLYTYADHIWANHPDRGDESLRLMREGINGSKNRWNFDNSEFIEAVTTPERAYNAMRDAINASTANSPLYIICAGPLQVVGTGIERAQANKRRFVTLISHSGWNETHANEPANNGNDIPHRNWVRDPNNFAWTWQRLMSRFGSNGITFTRILNQNSSADPDLGFSTKSVANVDQRGISRAERDRRRASNLTYWHWMRDHADANIQWVYERIVLSRRADASDAGMAWYLAHNDEEGGLSKLENFIGTGINTGGNNGGGGTPPNNGGGNNNGGGSSTYFHLQNKVSQKYVRPQNANGGANIVQVPNTWIGSWAQWKKVPTNNNYFRLENRRTGEFLRSPNNTNGAFINTGAQTNTSTEWREVTPNGDADYVFLQNRATNKYFRPQNVNDDLTPATGNNFNIEQQPSNFTGNLTRWRFVTVASSKLIEGETSDNSSLVTIFPNPVTNGKLEVFIDEQLQATSITILDMNGKIVLNTPSAGGQNTLDVENLSNGMYLLKVEGDTKSVNTKVIIK